MQDQREEKVPARMSLKSPDIPGERLEALRELLPEVFSEGRIDFEKLKLVLGENIDEGRERYGLTWAGKAEAIRAIQVPSTGTLVPVREESVEFDSTQNLMIEGDNLEVLKLLQKAYHGKIKMIYIDPPYNTGKEFIYPDNYRDGLREYLRFTGQLDDEGRKLTSNTETSGRYHSKWLSMMYPRLFLARNLLREDGVIFVSIDDHEVHNLRHLMDEIFGPENFVATFVWQKRTTRENRRVFSFNHDYILCFARNREVFQATRNLLPLTADVLARYSNPDNDPRGDWQSVSLNAQAGHATKSQFYPLRTPGGRVVEPPPGRCWIVTREKMEELIADGRVWFGADGNNVPRKKVFLSESRDGLTPHTLWTADEVGTNDSAKKALISLFDGAEVYETPKPVQLLERMIHIATSANAGELVLDFFAGSGTTGEAVLNLNHKDGGNRRFILVQLPEPTQREDYPTIAEIAKARLRKAAEVIRHELEGDLKLNGAVDIDLGFRTYRLAASNFKIWEPTADAEEELAQQLELYAESLEPGAETEAVLYELMLKAGIPLTARVEKLQLGGQDVFSVEGGRLLICLADPITRECIRAMIASSPQMVICLDHAFRGNDQLLTNTVLEMKSHGVEHFRTV